MLLWKLLLRRAPKTIGWREYRHQHLLLFEQLKKLQDRLEKCHKDVESSKDKYEEALAVLHKYNDTYVDDMTEVFERTQLFEEKRLRAFKEILVGIHGALDVSKRPELVTKNDNHN